MQVDNISVVIPAKNEQATIASLVEAVLALASVQEVIVVDDGSTDATGELAAQAGARVVRHPFSLGNGAAIKRGAREAKTEWVLFMDADGQHQATDIQRLVDATADDVDMAVGARDAQGQASIWRRFANGFYNWFASKVTEYPIDDLTSGFRLVRRKRFIEFLHLLPNGFSYPTTSTMAFLRSGYVVRFVPITVLKREGKSHIHPIKDGFRFVIIIFKIATLFSPLKVFMPIAIVHFLLGLGRYAYTYMESSSFTNMSALLMVTSVQIFLIGLVSEQITSLIYARKD
jgi:glycosyltransferase involved in cell wall biosynthesis